VFSCSGSVPISKRLSEIKHSKESEHSTRIAYKLRQLSRVSIDRIQTPPSQPGMTMHKFFPLLMAAFLTTASIAIAREPVRLHTHGPVRHQTHSRVYFGLGIGTGFYPGYWYGPPYYYGAPYYAAPVYTSPPVVIQQQPPVYVEQSPPPVPGYWYYCAPSKSYYPYVNDCPEAWQRVSPLPPPPTGATQ